MVEIGTVTGQEIRENRDGGVDVRLLQVQMAGDDVQTVQYMPTAGDDSPPMVGDKVAVVPIGPSFRVAMGVQDSVVPTAEAGEKKIYSRDEDGNIAASCYLKENGTIEIENANVSVFIRANGRIDAENVNGSISLRPSGSIQLLNKAETSSVTLRAIGDIVLNNALGEATLKVDGSWDANGVLSDILGNLTVPGNLLVGGSIGGGGVSMTGGNISTGGAISAASVAATSTVTAGAISLSAHTHGGVETGAGSTGGPQ